MRCLFRARKRVTDPGPAALRNTASDNVTGFILLSFLQVMSTCLFPVFLLAASSDHTPPFLPCKHYVSQTPHSNFPVTSGTSLRTSFTLEISRGLPFAAARDVGVGGRLLKEGDLKQNMFCSSHVFLLLCGYI